MIDMNVYCGGYWAFDKYNERGPFDNSGDRFIVDVKTERKSVLLTFVRKSSLRLASSWYKVTGTTTLQYVEVNV